MSLARSIGYPIFGGRRLCFVSIATALVPFLALIDPDGSAASLFKVESKSYSLHVLDLPTYPKEVISCFTRFIKKNEEEANCTPEGLRPCSHLNSWLTKGESWSMWWDRKRHPIPWRWIEFRTFCWGVRKKRGRHLKGKSDLLFMMWYRRFVKDLSRYSGFGRLIWYRQLRQHLSQYWVVLRMNLAFFHEAFGISENNVEGVIEFWSSRICRKHIHGFRTNPAFDVFSK